MYASSGQSRRCYSRQEIGDAEIGEKREDQETVVDKGDEYATG